MLLRISLGATVMRRTKSTSQGISAYVGDACVNVHLQSVPRLIKFGHEITWNLDPLFTTRNTSTDAHLVVDF